MTEIKPEVTDIVIAQGGKELEQCFQCGTCTAVCPWNIAGELGVRSLVHQAQLGLTDFGDGAIWKCDGCRACAQACPRGLDIPKIIRSLRRVISEVGTGSVPRSLRTAAANIAGIGNPLGEPREGRTMLAEEMNIGQYTKGTDIMLFTCCYQSYDNRCSKVARSIINILKKANIDFAVLDGNISCCGESIRKTGKEALFADLAANNIKSLKKAGVRKVLVSSPHCFNTFKDEYPEFGASFEVIHLVRYLDELVTNGKIKFNKPIDKKVTYHDSCLLGRYQGIYDEPRRILKAIPGINLIEMTDNCANALCCGGGAGGLWLESKKDERFAELRIRQAVDCGAQILAVSCPYCMTMFEDAALGLNAADSIEIKDVAELVWESIA
jgi:Fe-S oxidoreductase